MTNAKTVMNNRIRTFNGKVKTNRAELCALSRDLLTYVPKYKDAPAVCRLIDGQSPALRNKLRQFFNAFIGWEFNPDKEDYGKMKKDKVVQNKLAAAEKALADPEFNFESWFEASGVKAEKKPKDHVKAVGNAIKAALTEEGDNRMSEVALAQLVLSAEGLDLRKMMSALEQVHRLKQLES